MVKAVHDAGGKIMPQLWHVGTARRSGIYNVDAHPVSPSGISMAGEAAYEPLREDEIQELIQAYAQAAADAETYRFRWHGTAWCSWIFNRSIFLGTDESKIRQVWWDLVSRTQFAVEVIEACRAAVGPDFPIVLRFSQWKMGSYEARLVESPEELKQFLEPLSAAG